jgi:MFS family permease
MAPAQHSDDEPNGRLSATESTPLIDVVPPTAPLADGEEIKHYPGSIYRQTVLILIFSIMFIGEIGGGMINPPTNVLIEDILCRAARPQLGAAQRHPTIITNDPFCKGPEVQSQLALYKGWLFIVEAMPGAFLAIPYGILADRWGRKPVFLLSLAGIILGYAWYLAVCKCFKLLR